MKCTKTFYTLFVVALLATTAKAQSLNIPAQVDVSALGAATYTVPIEVVPGTNGMQPMLSVVYNSMSGMGVMGQKWSLQGISSITRAPQSLIYDDNITAVDFSTNDRYVLDGRRMLLSSETEYHDVNATYEFEVTDFSSVETINDGDDRFFIHRLENGGSVHYGKDAQSRFCPMQGECLYWFVSQVTDMDGNYMTYTYGHDNNEIWIDHIDYTFLSGTNSAFARVKFLYNTTTSPNDVYVSGRQIRQSKLLENINVYYQNNLVRRYNFVYTNDGQYDRLVKIRLYDDNDNLLSNTVITWDTPASELATLCPLSLFDQEYYVAAGNFNDDRIHDIFAVRKSDYSAFVALGNDDGTFSDLIYLHYAFPIVNTDNFSFRTCDIDGDGIDEIAFTNKITPMQIPQTRVYDLSIEDETMTYIATLPHSIFDVFFSNLDGNNREQVAYHHGSGLSFYDFFNSYFDNLNVTDDKQIIPGDFDGDGRSDFLFTFNHSAYVTKYDLYSSHWTVLFPSIDFLSSEFYVLSGDFNGDGTSDLLTYDKPSRKWQVSYYTKESGWISTTIEQLDDSPSGEEDDNKPKFIPIVYDINGDGKSDILQYVGDANLNFVISKGFYNGQYQIQTSGTIDCPSWADFKHNHFTTGDFDGNGIVDFFFVKPGEGVANILFFNKGSFNSRFVSKITDSGQKTIKLEYSTISLMPTHYVGYGMRWMPFPLVKKICVSNGFYNGYDTTQYYYGNAYFDTVRRQFLGFGLFGAKHGKRYSETFFSNRGNTMPTMMPDSAVNYVYTAPLEADIALYRSASTNVMPTIDTMVVSRTLSSNSALMRTLAGGNTQYLHYSSETNQMDYLKNINTQTIIQMGENWRPQSTETRKRYIRSSQEIPFYEVVHYTYGNVTLPSGRQAIRIDKKEVESYNNPSLSTPRMQTIYYSYASGRATEERTVTNDGSTFITKYTYNGNGTLSKVQSYPLGQSDRSEKYEYDPTYRFVEKKKDTWDRATNYTYDYATGRLLSQTGIDGLTTTYTYDNAGRPVSITQPDGSSKNFTYHTGSGGLSNVTSYTVIEETGKPRLKKYYDCLGKIRYTHTEQIGYMQYNYNRQGLLYAESIEPFTIVDPEVPGSHKFRCYKYDVFDRVVLDSSLFSKTVFSYASSHYYSGQPYYYVREHTNLGSVSTRYFDAAGRVYRVSDNGGDIYYNYYRMLQDGKVVDRTTITGGGNTTEILTDSRGNRLRLNDPDAGITTSVYNGWNELVSQTDALGNSTVFSYNDIGLLNAKTYQGSDGINETYSYSYSTTPASMDKPIQVRKNGAIYRSFQYDNLGRLTSNTKYMLQMPFSHSYSYNADGQVYTQTYPSGFTVRYDYNNFGQIKTIRDHATGDEIYKVYQRGSRALSPSKCFFGNNTAVEYTYGTLDLVTRIKYGYLTEHTQHPIFPDELVEAEENLVEQDELNSGSIGIGDDPGPGIVSPITPTYTIGSEYSVLNYTYDDKAYITSKSDTRTGQQETYSYDMMGRLASYAVGNAAAYTFTYNGNGNIAQNGRLGDDEYIYGIRPHAVNEAVIPDGMVSENSSTVTYNNRNRPKTISEGDWRLEIDYDDGQQRDKERLYHSNQLVEQTLFVSKFSEVIIKNNNMRYIDYINDENGHTVALHVHNNAANADSLYYVQTDLLGSWERIVDEDRNVVQSCHFDPWGNRMKADDWATSLDGTELSFHRGFTGHEHYDRFRIINMNARLYDPVIGRFFSPDPLVTNPYSTQGFNRYSYCGNNPVMYIDKNGESTLLIAAIVGAVLGAYTGGVLANEGEFYPWEWDFSSGTTWGYMFGGAITGGVSGFAGAAIAASGIPLGNTLALAYSSLLNSMGTYLYTEGKTPITINFGFASYDFSNEKFNYLGNNENSLLTNIGYFLGGMTNILDVSNLIDKTRAILYTEKITKEEWFSHTAVQTETGDNLISFGPTDKFVPKTDIGFALAIRQSTTDYTVYKDLPLSISLNHYAFDAVRLAAKILPYQGLTLNCVNIASLAFWLNGIPNLFLHPYLLYASLWGYMNGIRVDLMSYYLTNGLKIN
ncbi:MAG: hypothetical protein IJ634_03420 [Bacteroidales bacterium]|nr:hypothetical protein [Bacteroidales bacterium]